MRSQAALKITWSTRSLLSWATSSCRLPRLIPRATRPGATSPHGRRHSTNSFFAEQLTKDEFAIRLAALRDAKADAQDRLARLPARTTPSVVSLRAKWDGLSIEHKRRMLGSVIQAVFVRRAGRPGRHADAIHKRAKIIWRHEPELTLPRMGATAVNEIVPFDW